MCEIGEISRDMVSNAAQLAIVIPAYKRRFLADALASLAAQTDRRFRVYVGDDSSPDDISEICDQFKELDLSYFRFEQNLGMVSLIGQWNRCVELSCEPWVCLFSDDDLMDPGCVESFYFALDETRWAHSVYRFNTRIIDANGRLIRVNPIHPQVESGLQFAYGRLRFKRSSFAPEYVFSRLAFDRVGGFVEFPLGWCSDDASWVAFAGNRDIYTIQGPRVSWRSSRINLSMTNPAHHGEKMAAELQYLAWLEAWWSKSQSPGNEITREALHQHGRSWFFQQLVELNMIFGLTECVAFARRLGALWDNSVLENFCRLIWVDLLSLRRRTSRWHHHHRVG